MRILFSLGAIMALPVCWMDFQNIPWAQFQPAAYLALSLVVIGGTFLAYLFNVYGIKHLGPAISGSYIYTQPFFAAMIAMLVLGEKIDMYKIIAATLIFTGVYLSNKSKSNVQD
jgi:drug/metabolite transporter (DMT)-like permease